MTAVRFYCAVSMKALKNRGADLRGADAMGR
jgi:hypothetical protein